MIERQVTCGEIAAHPMKNLPQNDARLILRGAPTNFNRKHVGKQSRILRPPCCCAPHDNNIGYVLVTRLGDIVKSDTFA